MIRRLLPVFLLFVLCASAAFGDGCYIPERAVRKIPSIPAQRAIISWKDGVETLVISSSLDSASQSLGWIIPVPATPDVIEKETPGMMRTMNFCLQPKIIHDRRGQLGAAIAFAVLGVVLIGTLLFSRKELAKVLVVVFIIVMFFALMLPAAQSSSATATTLSGVRVEKSVSVGSYDVSVLSAKGPDDLNAWLDDNGFAALPAEADKTVEDYISQGWVFTAIKLTRDQTGVNTPHPIRISFASPKAVYPLRLTGVAGGETAFELFVIGDKTASSRRLVEEYCDRFMILSRDFREDHEKNSTLYKGENTDCRIGHPLLCRLMWHGCVITKYSGAIASADMTEDIVFDWKRFSPVQQTFYTYQGAWATFWFRLIAVSGAWCMISMILFRRRIREEHGAAWYFTKALLPVIVLFTLCEVAWFFSAPKLEPSGVHLSRMARMAPRHLYYSVQSTMEQAPSLFLRPKAEIVEIILDMTKDREFKNAAGEEIREEDSPGNFTLEIQPDKVVLRVYDLSGLVMIAECPLKDAKQDGD